MEGAKVPIFIQQGAAVLGNATKQLQRRQDDRYGLLHHGKEEHDIILQQYGEDHIGHIMTPELLRRVKLGQCDEEDVQEIKHLPTWDHETYLNRKHIFPCHEGVDNQEETPIEKMLPIASEAIQSHLWTKNILQHILEASQEHCTHVLSPHLLTFVQDSSASFPSSSSAFDYSVDINEETDEDDLSVEVVQSLLLKYGQIMNKLLKLQQLEQSRVTLLHDNFVLIKQIVDFPIQSNKLFSNIMNGVQLIPAKRSKITSLTHSRSVRLKPTSSSHNNNAMMLPHEELQQEIQYLKTNIVTIESFKQNEELFWKWFATSKYENLLLSQEHEVFGNVFGPYSHALQQLLPLTTKLQIHLQDIEEQVMLVLLSQKIPMKQVEVICQQENDYLIQQFSDILRIQAVPHRHGGGSLVPLLTQVMQMSTIPSLLNQHDYLTIVEELQHANKTMLMKFANECILPYAPYQLVFK